MIFLNPTLPLSPPTFLAMNDERPESVQPQTTTRNALVLVLASIPYFPFPRPSVSDGCVSIFTNADDRSGVKYSHVV